MRTRSRDELVAHVVWAVKMKARAPLLLIGDDVSRIGLFKAKAHDVGAVLLAAGCSMDHVHVLVRFPASRALSEVVQRLKGSSSRAQNLRTADELFRWQDGFWAQSCSPDDLTVVLAYVNGQRVHHATSQTLEPWEGELLEPG